MKKLTVKKQKTVDTIRSMAAKNKSSKEISKVVGKSKNSVRQTASEHGIKIQHAVGYNNKNELTDAHIENHKKAAKIDPFNIARKRVINCQ